MCEVVLSQTLIGVLAFRFGVWKVTFAKHADKDVWTQQVDHLRAFRHRLAKRHEDHFRITLETL